MNHLKTILGLLSIVLALTGCGGGGSESYPVSTTAYPVADAYKQYLLTPLARQGTIAGTVTSGNNSTAASGTITLQNVVMANSQPQNVNEQSCCVVVKGSLTQTLNVGGQSVTDQRDIFGYSDINTFAPKYSVTKKNGLETEFVAISASSIPLMAVVGATGTWYTATVYESSAKQTVKFTRNAIYDLETGQNGYAIVKLTVTDTDPQNRVMFVGTTRFRIGTDKSLVLISDNAIGYDYSTVPMRVMSLSISF